MSSAYLVNCLRHICESYFWKERFSPYKEIQNCFFFWSTKARSNEQWRRVDVTLGKDQFGYVMLFRGCCCFCALKWDSVDEINNLARVSYWLPKWHSLAHVMLS